MLVITSLTGVVLFAAIVVVVSRGVDYVRRHPELKDNSVPLAYRHCYLTLADVVALYKNTKAQATNLPALHWQSPNGRFYEVGTRGVEERRNANSQHGYRLTWDMITGVGVRMQPGFQSLDENRDGSTDSQVTTGYSFHLLIVPERGNTLDIPIPTSDNADAVDFVARTLALAEHRGKRVNIFGFDKPPAPHRQRVSRI